ncbi:MAG: DUF5711 family protein [Clostridiales bacterium]|nr:DUF5711 family protein [Clostridiales bacterium]
MKKHSIIRLAVILTLVAAAAIWFISSATSAGGFLNKGGETAFVTTGVTVDFDPDSGEAVYTPGSDGFYFATKDGARFITAADKQLMTEPYTMQNPVLFGAGDVMGVVEASGYDAYIYNTEGLMYAKHYENPIVNFSVTEQGYSCVVTKNGDDYESFVYNHGGAAIGHQEDTERIILSTAISNDGRIWAVSYLDISGAEYNSYITFGYLKKSEAQGYSDGIYGTLRGENGELNNQYFSMIRFMNGNNLIVVSDKAVFCVDAASPAQAKWIMPLDNELDQAAFYEGYAAFALGRARQGVPVEPAGRVILLNMNGERIFERDMGDRVTSLHIGGPGLIVGQDLSFTALGYKNQVLWEYNAPFDTRDIQFLDSAERTVIRTGTDVSIMKLTKIKEPEAAENNQGDE